MMLLFSICLGGRFAHAGERTDGVRTELPGRDPAAKFSSLDGADAGSAPSPSAASPSVVPSAEAAVAAGADAAGTDAPGAVEADTTAEESEPAAESFSVGAGYDEWDTAATEGGQEATPSEEFAPPSESNAAAIALTGYFGVESRAFFLKPATEGQLGPFDYSLVFAPKVALGTRSAALVFSGFTRVDAHDASRTHADIREAHLIFANGPWQAKVGIAQEGWGLVESRQLVSVVNQVDLLEGLAADEHLGQLLGALSLRDETLGSVSVFAMTGFRPIEFPSLDSRPTFPLPISDEVVYSSELGRWQPDVAVRWAGAYGLFDWGVSYFHGTSREPELLPQVEDQGVLLVPRYAVIHQVGLELQLTYGEWLFKSESIARSGQGPLFIAETSGIEYNVPSGEVSMQILLEHSYDGRDNLSLNLYQNDIFGGMRLALQDVASSQILIGCLADLESGGAAFQLRASRRFDENWFLKLEGRVFEGAHNDFVLNSFRNDHFARLHIQRQF